MEFMEELKQLGVDVQEGVERVVGDKSLYEMMLGMFLDVVSSNPVQIEYGRTYIKGSGRKSVNCSAF